MQDMEKLEFPKSYTPANDDDDDIGCECASCAFQQKTSVLDIMQEYQYSVESDQKQATAYTMSEHHNTSITSSERFFSAGTSILKQRELLDFLTRIDTSAIASPTPPAFLIVGSKHSGKSSFINSVYKLVYNEPGALIRRAETGYHGAVSSFHHQQQPPQPQPQPPTTLHYKFFPVLRSPLSSPRAPMFTLIDTPALQDSLREDELFNLLLNEVAESYDMATLFPECVILVVNSAQFDKEKAKFDWGGGVRVPNISRFLREEGMPSVIVITHMDLAIQRNVDTARMIKSLKEECGTDSVNCITNILAGGNNYLNHIGNSREIFHILEQAMTFARAERASCSKNT